MVKHFLRLLGVGAKSPTPASIPPGQRVYAIGDVHGRVDLLEQILDRIDEDGRSRPEADVSLVVLGDVVDRGPCSRQVLDLLLDHPGGHRLHCLLGNHEEMFLRVLDGDFAAVREWLDHGGGETVLSYGVSPAVVDQGDPEEIAQALADRVPRSHIGLLNKMPDHLAIGDYFFVHAGIRPGVPLDRQKSSDLRWIRGAFLDHEGSHGCIVVHGHNVVAAPVELSNRIGVDTGAYASGRLTALGLQGRERWFLTT